MSMTTHHHSFLVVAEPGDVVDIVVGGFIDFLKRLSHMDIVDITDRGVIADLNIRRGLSRFRDRLIITSRRSGENTVEINGVGRDSEFTVIVTVSKEFPHSRVDIDSTARSTRPGHMKAFLTDFSKKLEEYIRGEIRLRETRGAGAPAAPAPEQAVKPQPAKARPTPPPAPSPAVEAAEKPAKPPAPTLSPAIPPGRVIEEKMRDPVWMAQLLLKTELVARRQEPLPGTPKELVEQILQHYRGAVEKYTVVLVSIRVEDVDAHIIVNPVNQDIVAAKTTIGGILDYTGPEALQKLFEKKGQAASIKIWGIKEIPG